MPSAGAPSRRGGQPHELAVGQLEREGRAVGRRARAAPRTRRGSDRPGPAAPGAARAGTGAAVGDHERERPDPVVADGRAATRSSAVPGRGLDLLELDQLEVRVWLGHGASDSKCVRTSRAQ